MPFEYYEPRMVEGKSKAEHEVSSGSCLPFVIADDVFFHPGRNLVCRECQHWARWVDGSSRTRDK